MSLGTYIKICSRKDLLYVLKSFCSAVAKYKHCSTVVYRSEMLKMHSQALNIMKSKLEDIIHLYDTNFANGNV